MCWAWTGTGKEVGVSVPPPNAPSQASTNPVPLKPTKVNTARTHINTPAIKTYRRGINKNTAMYTNTHVTHIVTGTQHRPTKFCPNTSNLAQTHTHTYTLTHHSSAHKQKHSDFLKSIFSSMSAHRYTNNLTQMHTHTRKHPHIHVATSKYIHRPTKRVHRLTQTLAEPCTDINTKCTQKHTYENVLTRLITNYKQRQKCNSQTANIR